MKTNKSISALVMIILLLGSFSKAAKATTIIKDLKVEYLKNPQGIDVAEPRFSWKMESDERGVSQTAYQIKVSTDPEGNNTIWDSGMIESDKSVHIKYSGSQLSPLTRYYWTVSVQDQKEAEIVSDEPAYFETGLMNSGWSNAKWIKASSNGNSGWNNISDYTLEMDFEIKEDAVGPIFGAVDENNYYMWQINIGKQTNKTYFRPHAWKNGNASALAEVDITSKIKVEKNTVYKLKIEIVGKTAKTYINDILVDERLNPSNENYGFGRIGFRANRGNQDEDSYVDNIKLTTLKGGESTIVFSEDFSDPSDVSFTYGSVENGRLFLKGGSTSPLSWQKSDEKNASKFDLEMDMTLVNQSAGIIFSAQDTKNFYMWSVIISDNSDNPILRRHYFKNSNVSSSDINIGSYFKKTELQNKERHIKIAVDKNVVKTYIDGVLVDTYQDQYSSLISGSIGFRAYNGSGTNEISYFDNVSYTEYVDDNPAIKLSEDFESESLAFEGAQVEVVNGNRKMKMFSSSSERILLDAALSSDVFMFRTNIALDKEVRSAKISTSALGIYDLFINNKRVGRTNEKGQVIYDELKPGWTDYSKTVFYSVYDVSSFLQQGNNAMGAYISEGWWKGEVAHGEYGNLPLAFIAKLIVEYTDGSTQTFVTNPDSWTCNNNGAIRLGSIYGGESYDARQESNWTSAAFDDSNWNGVLESNDFNGSIKSFVGPTVQVRSELERAVVKTTKYEGIAQPSTTTYGAINVIEEYNAPASITLKKGQTVVYDMGQNMVGWVKFQVKGNSGAKMKLRFAEMLNDNGDASRSNDGPGGSLYTAALRGARAQLYYTLKGDADGEIFNPSTTFFGFRYCDITASEDIEISWIKGEVVGTTADEVSSFETSNSLVNQLYSNILWGQRGNFLSIPTDCPQRDERLGWTGDIQVFGRAATYNADLAAFFHKWMGDMRDSQRADGAYPDVAPHAWVGWGQAAWAEAGIVVPWNVYLMYDDLGIIEENFASMEKYMKFLENQKGDGFKYNGAGTNYGDWLAYEGTDSRFVSVCFYAYAAQLMEKMSKAMSKSTGDTYDNKATSYRTLSENIKKEFQTRYLNADNSLKQTTQTAYLLALKLDLFPNEESKTAGIKALRQKIVTNGNKLATGFVGTGIINQTLSDMGETDVAYNLLLQRNNPSWLYSVDQGATTIWERWDSYTKENGFNPVTGMNSFNHYAYGAVSEWMYRYVAGINPDEATPGFKHIIIAPSLDTRSVLPSGQKRITSANASYDSYYGLVKSAWETDKDKKGKYSITIPANTTATVILPLNTETDEIYENNKSLDTVEGVSSFHIEDNQISIELKSGSYEFETKKKGLSINEIQNTTRLRAYPNPVEGKLYIEADNPISEIELYSTSGVLIYSQDTNAPIDMGAFNQGIYFLCAKGDNNYSQIVKIVKK